MRAADSTAALAAIRSADPPRGIDPSPVRVHLFEWSALSLGWYESLLWGFVFAAEAGAAAGAGGGGGGGRGGVWAGTAVKLFRVQEVAPQTPSLLAPRGAVDAVGSNLVQSVQRIGSLSLGGGGTSTAGTRGEAGRPVTVRDV